MKGLITANARLTGVLHLGMSRSDSMYFLETRVISLTVIVYNLCYDSHVLSDQRVVSIEYE